MKRRAALVLACACAAAPPAPPSPTPTPVPRARVVPPDAAPAVAAAAPACLRDSDATTVSLLDGDAHKIDVCFASSSCFAIDRRTSAMRAWQPAKPPLASMFHSRSRITIHSSGGWTRVCAGDDCIHVPRAVANVADVGQPLTGDIDSARGMAAVVLPGATQGDPPTTAILSEEKRAVVTLTKGGTNRCADAIWAGDDVLVTTDDCDGGNVHGTLFDVDGHVVHQILDDHPLDTRDAYALAHEHAAAILAPHAYALVVVADTLSAVNLAPIQAVATSTPVFEMTSLDSSHWLVASATGGVGIVDQTASAFVHTWIVPRCEASP